ncbi:MAG: hypothetical protein J07HQX50_01688 [Haloquadratum sp. J07HQX50]|jgi:hypothetical protein|nr:MAG: hypothetical protein J07HQX50_01688 [Haloquadratum sp. J07HQX50]
MIAKSELVTPCPQCGSKEVFTDYTDSALYVGDRGPDRICAKWQCSDCNNRWETNTEYTLTGIEYGETSVKGSGDPE